MKRTRMQRQSKQSVRPWSSRPYKNKTCPTIQDFFPDPEL